MVGNCADYHTHRIYRVIFSDTRRTWYGNWRIWR
ncbi:MAG: hypothetical protein KJ043_13505 [Anaerolineae bacterium]|nr:hypothetical protein [Anaerolineae bacterium]